MSSTIDLPKTDLAWFDERPSEGQISQSARQLLETYSGIAPENVVEHVVNLRNQAWRIHPYPCIGQFRFLQPGIDELDEYPEVIERLRKGEKLLDMACCFGQTTRRLVADGAPSENIYGCDLKKDFIDLGYGLFKDQDKLKTKFVVAEIFDSSSPLKDFQGSFDMIYAGSFFHLWGWQKQKEVSKLLVQLLRQKPGSMILGRQMGVSNTYGNEIGKDLGITFKVNARLKSTYDNDNDFEGDDTNVRRIYFSVRRE